MAKLIVSFITSILELAAILFLIAGGVAGHEYAINHNREMMFISVFVGIAIGFLTAAIVLGIPLMIVRMNQNLEQINATLNAIKDKNNDTV